MSLKAPEAIAGQIASIIIQHLLLTPEPPEELQGSYTLEEMKELAKRGTISIPASPACEAWNKAARFVSHRYDKESEHMVISFRIGSKIAFQLAYRSIL